MSSRLLHVALRASAFALLTSSAALSGQVAVSTYHNDNYRSGVNSQETILTPSNVNEVTFGKRLVLPVNGYIYGQPLYVPEVSIQRHVAQRGVCGHRA